MARDVSIQRAETWLYLDDVKDKVLVWDGKKPAPAKDGNPPDDQGGFFRVKPTPFDLVAESLLGAGKAPKHLQEQLDKPSVVMQRIIEETIDSWRGVKHPDTKDLVAFEGPGSVAYLPAMFVNLLGGWIYKRIMETPQGKKVSAATRKKRGSSGRSTRGRKAASNATS